MVSCKYRPGDLDKSFPLNLAYHHTKLQRHNISIESCPLVKSLRESGNIHRIQEYEEKDMGEQLQNLDLY
jgi:hypothetical protein